MGKKTYILIIVIIGLFMIPSISFACGSGCCAKKFETKKSWNSDKHSKQQSAENECCHNKNKSKNGNGCNGKCKHNSCNCTTSVLSLIIPSFSELTINHFDFSNQKKNFTFEEFNTSSGFYYIWTPPNIG